MLSGAGTHLATVWAIPPSPQAWLTADSGRVEGKQPELLLGRGNSWKVLLDGLVGKPGRCYGACRRDAAREITDCYSRYVTGWSVKL